MRDRDRVEPLGRAFEVGVGVGGEMLSRKAVSEDFAFSRLDRKRRVAQPARHAGAPPPPPPARPHRRGRPHQTRSDLGRGSRADLHLTPRQAGTPREAAVVRVEP